MFIRVFTGRTDPLITCHCEAVLLLAVLECELFCVFRSEHVEKQEKLQQNEKIRPKVRRHHSSKSDEPDLQESAFLKKIIAYQRKLLVQILFLFFVLTVLINCLVN